MAQSLELTPLKGAMDKIVPISPEEKRPKQGLEAKPAPILAPITEQVASNHGDIASTLYRLMEKSWRKIFRLPYPILLATNHEHFLQQTGDLTDKSFYDPLIAHWNRETKMTLTENIPFYFDKNFQESVSLVEKKQYARPLMLQLEQLRLVGEDERGKPKKRIREEHDYRLLTALAILYLSFRDVERARESASRLFRHYRDNPYASLLYAFILMQNNALYRKPLSVLRHVEKIRSIDPSLRFVALEQIVALQIRHQLVDEAVRSFQKLIQFALRHNILHEDRLIELFIHASSLATKISSSHVACYICEKLKPIVRKTRKPTHLLAYHHIFARMQCQEKNWDKALHHLQIAKKLSPLHQNKAVLLDIIAVAKKAGKHATVLQATSELRAYVLQKGEHSFALSLGIIIATYHEKLQQWQAGLHVLYTLLKEAQAIPDPLTVAEILNRIGYSYIRLGQYPQAQQRLHHASDLSFTLSKNKPQIYQMSCMLTGMLAVRTNKFSSADYWFERARCYSHKVDKLFAASLANLGYLKFQQGQEIQAIRSWERARNVYRHQKNPKKIEKMNRHIENLYAQKPRIHPVLSPPHQSLSDTNPASEFVPSKSIAKPAPNSALNSAPGPTLTNLRSSKPSVSHYPPYTISKFELP